MGRLLAVCTLLLHGCFAYYQFHQSDGVGVVGVTGVTGEDGPTDDEPTQLTLTLTPAHIALFSNEQVVVHAAAQASLAEAVTLRFTAAHLSCADATIAAGTASIDVTCTAAAASSSGDETLTAAVVTEGFSGGATLAYAVSDSARFTASPTALTVKRGASIGFTLSQLASDATPATVSVALESSDPSLMLTPAALTSSSAPFTLTANGDAGAPVMVAVNVAVTSGGVTRRLPIDVTIMPRPGSLDTTFGTNGHFVFDESGNGFAAKSVFNAVLPTSDGGVVLAGTANPPSTYDVALVAKLTSGGALDPAFSLDGYVTHQPSSNESFTTRSAGMGGSEAVFVCGLQSTAGAQAAVIRFRANGTLDGIATEASSSGCADLVVDATSANYAHVDGSAVTHIVAVNQGTMADPTIFSLDFSNDVNGWLSDNVMCITGAGPYYLGGYADAANASYVAKISTPASNLLDQSFSGLNAVTGTVGASGVVFVNREIPMGSTPQGVVYDALSLPDGKVLAVGSVAYENRALLMRMGPNGLDPSFGSGGLVMAQGDATKMFLVAQAVTTQTDGKILVAGASYQQSSAFVMRRLADGAVDPTFGDSEGIIWLPTLGPNYSVAFAVAVAADGKILVAGAHKCGNGGCAAAGTAAEAIVFRLWP